MTEFNLMKYKNDEWEHLKEDCDKCVIVGRLEMLNDLTDYMDALKESYTRLLVVNDVDEKKYETLKKRHKHVKGLDGSCDDDSDECGAIKVNYSKDDDGDDISFDNC